MAKSFLSRTDLKKKKKGGRAKLKVVLEKDRKVLAMFQSRKSNPQKTVEGFK